MRLLFAHDHRFQRGPAGDLYTLGSFPASVWERYLEHFENLHVIARDGGAVSNDSRLARADREGVTFEFLPSLASPLQLMFPSREVDERMTAAVRAADAVVARVPSEIGLLALRHARRLGKPYAVEVVGCAWDGYLNLGGSAARLYAPLGFLRMRRAIAKAPLALYVTSAWLQNRYPTNGDWSSASNVYLVPMRAEEGDAREARLEALARGQRPVLGTVASLWVKSKGVQTALAALSQLRSSGLELTYRVLGSGPVEPWRRLAESLGVGDLVRFEGTRKAGEGVCRWLDGIDIYLQPSFQEGLPRGTIEAMSRGAACIGSSCGGIQELLPEDRMHRPGDVAGLASRIRALAEDPAAIAAASRADLQKSREFDPDELQARRREFYARLRAEADRGAASS